MNYVRFFEFLHILFGKNAFVEISLEVREILKFFRTFLFTKLLNPSLDFALNFFFDDFFEVERPLVKGFVMLVMNDGRYSFNKDGEVIFTDIILLQKVVKFIGVDLIPNEEGDADGYEDEIEDRQGYHRLFELSFMSIRIREQLEHILQTKSAHF